jgi:putrescine transport system substrate-binding protein
VRFLLHITLLLLSISSFAEEEPVVNIYTWADYIPPDTIRGFEEEFGIRIVYDTYANDIIVISKMLAGSTGYDLVGLAGVDLQRLLPVGVFQKQDKSRLPNLKNMDPEIIQRAAFSDPGNEHAFIYAWGSTGIAYNVDMVHERMPNAPLHSAAMVFDPAVISRFADCGVSFLDDPGTVMRLTLLYLGYDINTTDEVAWAEAEQVLKSVHPYVRYYDSSRLLIDLPAEEICVGITWTGDFRFAENGAFEAGADVRLAFQLPIEGANDWTDMFLMPNDAPHPRNAHIFLNYLMRAEVGANTGNYNFYNPGNLAAHAFVRPDVLSDPFLFPPPEMLKRIHTRTAWKLKDQRRLNRIWANLKAGFE